MFYEVRANIFFHSEDEARDFYHDCQVALPKGSVVNPCAPNQQCSIIDHLICRHDENPNEACTSLGHEDNCPECPQ